MKLLQELLTDYQRLDQEEPAPELELDPGEGEALPDEQLDPESEEGLEPEEVDPDVEDLAAEASDDPDRQGLIRVVKGAHLVYKREQEDGTYEELWIYNISTLRHELDIRKAIIAGTDIPVDKTTSPDGSQSYSLWSAGNAELILIKGLQN